MTYLIHIIGKGWIEKSFRTEAQADRWFERNEGNFDEVRMEAK